MKKFLSLKESIMKHINISLLLTMLICMVGTKTFAYDFAMDNADGVTIYYSFTNNNTELAVSYRGDYYISYKGSVIIPESVTYNAVTYPVTSIGSSAFNDCRSLTSVTIPNSVTNL